MSQASLKSLSLRIIKLKKTVQYVWEKSRRLEKYEKLILISEEHRYNNVTKACNIFRILQKGVQYTTQFIWIPDDQYHFERISFHDMH